MMLDTIRQIFDLTTELERKYPGRYFTPDGHMLGSIGEVYAAEHYGLTLYPASHEVHDAFDVKGRQIQIKITQTERIALSSQPDYLIVLRIDRTGTIEEVYNGPGKTPWEMTGAVQKNGQRAISLKKLRSIKVPECRRIGFFSDETS